MDAPVPKGQVAWQPFTPRGVAAFARASFRRLLAMELIIGALAAGAVAWVLHHDWFPVINRAISQLPTEGEIRFQQLDWRADSPARLADNQWLAVSVDLTHAGQARSPAHLQVELGRSDVRFISIFGFVPRKYPAGWRVAFNRPQLIPWWGAWAPAILAMTAALVLVGLLLTWTTLASLYFLIVLLIAFFANRDLGMSQSWRLSSAALMPGAFLFTLAILLYGQGSLDLLRLLVAAGLHVIIGWIYLLTAIRALPFVAGETKAATNPFTPPAKMPPHPN